MLPNLHTRTWLLASVLCASACVFEPPGATRAQRHRVDLEMDAALAKDGQPQADADLRDGMAADTPAIDDADAASADVEPALEADASTEEDAATPDEGVDESCVDPCTDPDPCVQNELCLPSVGCHGYLPVLGSCGGGCGACPAASDACCSSTCPAGVCETCDQPGSSCDFTCNSRNCSTTCGTGSACHVDHNASVGDSTGTTMVTCQPGANCDVDCFATGDDGVLNCNLDCEPGAFCLLSNCGCTGDNCRANCTINCQGGTTVSCGGDVLVCGRGCP